MDPGTTPKLPNEMGKFIPLTLEEPLPTTPLSSTVREKPSEMDYPGPEPQGLGRPLLDRGDILPPKEVKRKAVKEFQDGGGGWES